MEKKRPSEHVKQVYFPDRKSLRAWLKINHDKEKSIWLVYDKISMGGKLTYDDIVEEALCFGWIDSLVRGKDEKQSMLYFSQRKKGSTWSKVNKERLPKLIESGLMTEAGLRLINEAKIDGSWDSLNLVDDLVLPDLLEKEFSKNKIAKENYEKLSPSIKKQVLYYIYSAKQEETKEKRVEKMVEALASNQKPFN